MLSTAAFNAFLKTLEEPPAHVIFILATTEKHKILPTIISRCQIYDFERMTVPGIIEHLKSVAAKENITYEEEALAIIAEKADGGMRDALSIFDQVVSFCQGNITYQGVIEDLYVLDSDNYFNIIDLAYENKVADIMALLNSIITKGFDGGNLINGLASHVRNVLMAKDEVTLPLLEVSQRQRERYREQAQKCATKFLYRALEIMNRCDINYRQSSNKRLLVELTLIEVAQITQPEDDSSSSGRSPKRLKSLFKNLIIPQPKAARQVVHEEKHSPTPSAPRLKLGNIGISFSDLQREKKSQSGQQEEESARNEAKNQPFGPDELDMQWIVMCNQLPQKQTAMAARMKNMSIRITDFPHIEVLADNEIMLEQVGNLKDWIRTQLASLLHNDNLDISIRLAKAEEMRKILTPKETFENMRKENPAIEKLKEMLNLELT